MKKVNMIELSSSEEDDEPIAAELARQKQEAYSARRAQFGSALPRKDATADRTQNSRTQLAQLDLTDDSDEEKSPTRNRPAQVITDDENRMSVDSPSESSPSTRRSSETGHSATTDEPDTSLDVEDYESKQGGIERESRPRRASAQKPLGAYAAKRNKVTATKTKPNTNTTHSPPVSSEQPEKIAERVELPPFVPSDSTWTQSAHNKIVATQSRLRPSARCIVGPTWPGELSSVVQDAINIERMDALNSNPLAKIDTSWDNRLFEQIANAANRDELGDIKQRRIRVKPQHGHPERSPPFEFVYTNRVLYEGKFLPVTPEGCACVGSCSDPANFASCACRVRQELACTTRVGSLNVRTELKGFAYNDERLLDQKLFKNHERIVECNSSCGCGPECINRVAGQRPSVAVDIFHTKHAGWAVRNPPSYASEPNKGRPDAYEGRTIKRGTALGIYAGEMITKSESFDRFDCYDEIGRNYLYSLDTWTTAEELGFFDEDENQETHLSEETKKRYKGGFLMDAFSYGNWTRFCNHKCNTHNAAPRSVQVDDADPRRPMWVFFATRDIKPGEEITIAYHEEATGFDPAKFENVGGWQAQAKRRRKAARPNDRCYCGDVMCYGVIFEREHEVDYGHEEEAIPEAIQAELAAVEATAV